MLLLAVSHWTHRRGFRSGDGPEDFVRPHGFRAELQSRAVPTSRSVQFRGDEESGRSRSIEG